jgi:hypothetical protein
VAGVTDTELQRRKLVRITNGWYVETSEPLELVEQCRGMLAALPADSVFSDSTAARLYGLPMPRVACEATAPTHITLTPRACVPQRREVVVHRRALPPDDVRAQFGLPVTTPERTFMDLAMTLSSEELAVVGDALLHTELSTPDTLQNRIGAARRRRGIGVARAVLPLLDGRAQSPPETVVRLRFTAAGLVAVPQCPVYSSTGELIGHADLGFPNARIAIEYEGRQHAEGEQFDYDIDRYSRFAAAGWLVIRCGRRDLADGSAALIGRVRAALAAR